MRRPGPRRAGAAGRPGARQEAMGVGGSGEDAPGSGRRVNGRLNRGIDPMGKLHKEPAYDLQASATCRGRTRERERNSNSKFWLCILCYK